MAGPRLGWVRAKEAGAVWRDGRALTTGLSRSHVPNAPLATIGLRAPARAHERGPSAYLSFRREAITTVRSYHDRLRDCDTTARHSGQKNIREHR